ncbi:MAG TPA: thiolase family protein [Polyangiales bacterium]|nr:thiolase family protein [Polyangiales bacterium]
MTPAVILAAVRTPIGKFQGSLRSKSASDLAAVAIREAARRAEIPPADVDEVIFGNVLAAGLGQGPSRLAALIAGLPHSVPATTLSKVCGSGLRAVMGATQSIACGDAKVVVAGGMESMSNAPHLLARARSGYRLGHGELIDVILRDGLICSTLGLHMGEIADRCARTYRVSREEQDAFAAESYRRARAAIEGGAFKREIVAVEVGGTVPSASISQDEQPYADDIEKLGKLKPAFEDDGTVTAGNASSLNDGAAALVLAAEGYTRRKPMARVVAYASAAQAPEDFATAPIHAIRSVLDKAGLRVQDIDLFEINQAFSVASIVVSRVLELSPAQVDVNGGAVALGHPIGASGARILVTLLHAMQRREAKRGIATVCIGGGEAVAMLVERP